MITTVIAADGDYGAGTYGTGDYNEGYVTPISPTPTSGGGGGSSSSSISSLSIKFTNNKGTQTLNKGKVSLFSLGKQNHRISIDSIGENSATVIIQSTPQSVELNLNEPKKVDIDFDGIDDIEIELLNVYSKSIKFEITLIEKEEPVEEPIEEPVEEPNEEPVEKPKEVRVGVGVDTPNQERTFSKLWIVLGIVFLVSLVAFGIHQVYKNKKEE